MGSLKSKKSEYSNKHLSFAYFSPKSFKSSYISDNKVASKDHESSNDVSLYISEYLIEQLFKEFLIPLLYSSFSVLSIISSASIFFKT